MSSWVTDRQPFSLSFDCSGQNPCNVEHGRGKGEGRSVLPSEEEKGGKDTCRVRLEVSRNYSLKEEEENERRPRQGKNRGESTLEQL